MIAEVVGLRGHNGDPIEAYVARPTGPGPHPSVIVMHHGPAWDEWSKEVTRKLAHNGYAAICPNLFSRHGLGDWKGSSDRAHAVGEPLATPDVQVVGDSEACELYLRDQPWSNGKVGVIGFCSGGRLAYMLACKQPTLNAAVDCWGGFVKVMPGQTHPQKPEAFDMTSEMTVPLLGLFGNEDANPSPEQVDLTEAELKKFGKEYEFHRFDGAGHGFFATERPTYRVQQAIDGWKLVFDFYNRKLGGPAV
jgi:carboxymethylenebutenolidase